MDQNTPARFKNGNLRRKLSYARLRHAVGAMETLITFMVTVLATLFIWLNAAAYSIPQWSWIAVMFAGLGAASILIAISMTDPESVNESITLALEDYFQVESITDAGIRNQFSQAVSHRARLQEVFHRSSGGMRGEVLKALVAVDEWLTGMGHLAQLLVPYQSEVKRQSETKLHLLDRITQLEYRVGEASDPRIKAQLRETIAGRRHQQRAIEELESLVERGHLRLERAVAALGTMNAQLSMLAARGEQETNAAKLAHDINAEIQEIDAVLLALDRVHSNDLATLDITTLENSQ
jgi:hypothetical protein